MSRLLRPETTARFYIEALGLKEVGKINSPTAKDII